MTDTNLSEQLRDGEPLADFIRPTVPLTKSLNDAADRIAVAFGHAGGPEISRAEYIKLFRAEVDRLAALTDSKNANYANDADALANFRLIEVLSGGRLTTADGLFTRITDKIQRALNLHLGAANNHESMADNLSDLAVYALILKIHFDRGGR